MWPPTYNLFTASLAVSLCSLSVKLMDDHLDQERDRCCGRANMAERLGAGTIAYAAMLLALAAGLDTALSLSLFLASYVVGMFNDLSRIMPTRLSGWQESAVVFALGGFLFGFRIMLFALLFIIAVQLFDDCIDSKTDRLCGQRNFACRLGLAECLLAGVAALAGACWLDETLFLPALIGTGLAYGGMLRYQGVKQG